VIQTQIHRSSRERSRTHGGIVATLLGVHDVVFVAAQQPQQFRLLRMALVCEASHTSPRSRLQATLHQCRWVFLSLSFQVE
jgi:hypothetical protein